MTIDEAIAKYKEIINTESNCPAHCNISCDKCVQESGQLAEWLEELKTNRIALEKANGYLEVNHRLGYNKAIDDFVKKISESNQGHWRVTKYEHCEAISETMSYDIGTIKLIAEQLKAGVEDEKEKRM